MDFTRYFLAGGVLATAGAIGFVMQNGDTAKTRYISTVEVPDISGTEAEPLEVTDIELTSASAVNGAPAQQQTSILEDTEKNVSLGVDSGEIKSEDAIVQTAALGEEVAPVVNDAIPAPESLCEIEMTAEPVASAMVDLTIKASCYANERVTLHHNGMMFTDVTDSSGTLEVMVPALAENAVFIAAFANGEGVLANAEVNSLEFYDRMVIQSKARSSLHINAFEFGANFRGEGHVTAASERSLKDAALGEGGFITTLGELDSPEGLVAEVYTFPTVTAKQQGDVFVSVDAEITDSNCGLHIEAQTLEVREGGKMKVQDLSLPIPACDAVGDFLVLQNLLPDLKVARN